MSLSSRVKEKARSENGVIVRRGDDRGDSGRGTRNFTRTKSRAEADQSKHKTLKPRADFQTNEKTFWNPLSLKFFRSS